MKKIIATSAALLVVGSITLSPYKIDAKSFKKNESYSVEDISNLKVFADSWDVKFKKSNSNKITISTKGKQKDKNSVTIKRDGEDLIIKQKKTKKSGFFGGFTFGKQSGTISISVPESEIKSIELTNKDGNIQMSKISADSIVVENNAGEEKINGISANSGKFASKDGSLNLKNSSFEELKITSTSGDNYMKDVDSSKIKITSKDGAVSIKNITEGESLTVKTVAGDIGLSYKKAPTSLAVSAESKSSDVKLNLDGLKKSKNTEKLKKGKIGQGVNKLSLSSGDGAINVTN